MVFKMLCTEVDQGLVFNVMLFKDKMEMLPAEFFELTWRERDPNRFEDEWDDVIEDAQIAADYADMGPAMYDRMHKQV